MKIIDDKARAAFNGPGLCELCGQWAEIRDCHHTFFKKGMGGGSQLDVPENLAALHRVPCHNLAENHQDVNLEVRDKVAARCGIPDYRILSALHAIRNLDRHDHAGAQAILQTLRKRADDPPGREGDGLPPGDVGPSPAVREAGIPSEQTVSQDWRTF